MVIFLYNQLLTSQTGHSFSRLEGQKSCILCVWKGVSSEKFGSVCWTLHKIPDLKNWTFTKSWGEKTDPSGNTNEIINLAFGFFCHQLTKTFLFSQNYTFLTKLIRLTIRSKIRNIFTKMGPFKVPPISRAEKNPTRVGFISILLR